MGCAHPPVGEYRVDLTHLESVNGNMPFLEDPAGKNRGSDPGC
jgi:hypothetical protein